jgi:hypothetical protein
MFVCFVKITLSWCISAGKLKAERGMRRPQNILPCIFVEDHYIVIVHRKKHARFVLVIYVRALTLQTHTEKKESGEKKLKRETEAANAWVMGQRRVMIHD